MGRDFDQKIELWLKDDPHRIVRLGRAILGLYHNKLPRELRPFGMMHWVWKTSVASSAPAVAYAFYGSISAVTAVSAASAIFLGHSLVSFLDRMSKEKKVGALEGQSEILIRFGDLLAALRANSTALPERDDAIRSCLGILEIFARQTTKSTKGDVSVSLVLYTGNSSARMRVKHRNPGNDRPINREFDSRYVAGHYACEAGALPRVVHDIKWFGREGNSSPTQSMVNYRSIFIIPLEKQTTNGNRVRGFVSIDCRRPYAFYGNRANVIIVTCEPVINHIRDLI